MLSSNDEMDIKQLPNAICTVLTNISNRLIGRSQGHWPTSDEIENNKVKSLANRLKAESYKETLTNILEWQDRNIVFWSERWPVSILFNVTVIFFLVFLPVFLFYSQILWWIIAMASSAVTTFLILAIILKFVRKIPMKDGLKNIFMQSISMDTFLENKLGVCRDYAKLTACLLSNIYPNAEICFANTRDHTATGIVIKNRLYMLDQHLPILTIDKWRARYDPHLKEIEQFMANGRPKKVDIKPYLSTTKTTSLDTKRIVVTMTKLLNIKEQTDDKATSLEIPIPWKKGAILYEENEMVDYSLARRLETRISSELIRINQITRIEISHQKDDLIFLIRFSQNK